MARLRPGWLVVLCSAILLVSSWLPWLVTGAGGHASAIGGQLQDIGKPPAGFGVGQLIVLLAPMLMVAAAMAARGLYGKIASTAALAFSVLLTVLVVWYHRLYVGAPIGSGYGYYIAAGAVMIAVVLSVLTMIVAWSESGRRR